MERFCIFCGNKPLESTKEHILPKWLIELTGNINRLVKYGAHPVTGKQKEFGWINFKFPSCNVCNNKRALLENKTFEIVKKLLNRENISTEEANTFLDWLDKVRIGMWLAYHYLHENSLRIAPRFYIDSRIDKKDRMLALYFLDKQSDGLNIWGAETLLFQLKPSCFSMKINNVYLLNMSWDFMCSKRCGFPYPKYIKNKEGLFIIEKFRKETGMKSPIHQLGVKLYPPALQLYQPQYEEQFELMIKDLGGHEKKATFVQQEKTIRQLFSSEKIFFNGLRVKQSIPLQHFIAQMYDFQLKSLLIDKDIFLPDLSDHFLDLIKLENYKSISAWINLTDEENKRIWGKN